MHLMSCHISAYFWAKQITVIYCAYIAWNRCTKLLRLSGVKLQVLTGETESKQTHQNV